MDFFSIFSKQEKEGILRDLLFLEYRNSRLLELANDLPTRLDRVCGSSMDRVQVLTNRQAPMSGKCPLKSRKRTLAEVLSNHSQKRGRPPDFGGEPDRFKSCKATKTVLGKRKYSS
jgi:hypothetical protein